MIPMPLRILHIYSPIYNNTSITMLSFSSEDIMFQYSNNSHLTHKLSVKNTSLLPVYFKFKVNRPRYYLVKPDRGVIQPGATTDINIKLHKEGISEANSDKFKCFYAKLADGGEKEMDKFEERLDTEQRKMVVMVNNIPPGLESVRVIPPASSELKSLGDTRSKVMNSNRGSTTYESLVREKQDRVSSLKSEIESIQRSVREKKIAEGPKKKSSSWLPLIGVTVLGALAGLASSIWI